MVTELAILTPAECGEVRTRLFALRNRWIRRSFHDPRCTFFTLGPAITYDVRGSDDPQRDYYSQVTPYNALLDQVFSQLLEAVQSALERHLSAPVYFSNNHALPGFHIFRSSAIRVAAQAQPHFDMQYQYVPWPIRWDDDAEPFSFTLAVSLPRRGSGLDLWNLTHADTIDNSGPPQGRTSLEQLMEEKGKTYYPYTPGQLLFQQGLPLHRIASPTQVSPRDERVTLQGHGLRFGGRWLLYW